MNYYYNYTFEDILMNIGTITASNSKIRAELYVAMSEEANITVNQQRVINK